MKKTLSFLFSLIFVLAPLSANGQTLTPNNMAQVIYTQSGCNYYVVDDVYSNYDIIQWMSGSGVANGDILKNSTFNKLGYQYMTLTTPSGTFQSTGVIEDYGLTSYQAAYDYYFLCPTTSVSTTVSTPVYYNTNSYYNEYTANPASGLTSYPTYTAPVYSASTYVNSYGNTVQSPSYDDTGDATASCSDGTYSYSQHRSGTCSGHGGVFEWLQ